MNISFRRSPESHNLIEKKLRLASLITLLLNPPHETSNPWSALNVWQVPCKLLKTETSTGDDEDLTWTQIRGGSNPKGPEPAKISTPPSGPGSERFVIYPWAWSIASTNRARSWPLNFLLIYFKIWSLAVSSISKKFLFFLF